MSPKKRSKKILALPFLMTVAASSCVVKNAPPPAGPAQPGGSAYVETETGGSSEEGEAKEHGAVIELESSEGSPTTNAPVPTTGGSTPGVATNPPLPTQTKAPIKAKMPTRPTANTPTKLKAAPSDNGRVQKRADGTCWWIAKVECPKDRKVSCNPPMPQQVKCPE